MRHNQSLYSYIHNRFKIGHIGNFCSGRKPLGIGAKEICTAFSVVMTMDLSWQIAKAGDKLYHIWLLKSCFPMSLDISSMNKTPSKQIINQRLLVS